MSINDLELNETWKKVVPLMHELFSLTPLVDDDKALKIIAKVNFYLSDIILDGVPTLESSLEILLLQGTVLILKRIVRNINMHWRERKK